MRKSTIIILSIVRRVSIRGRVPKSRATTREAHLNMKRQSSPTKNRKAGVNNGEMSQNNSTSKTTEANKEVVGQVIVNRNRRISNEVMIPMEEGPTEV